MKDKFLLVLDSPNYQNEELTMKDTLIDESQDPSDLHLEDLNELIVNDTIRKAIMNLSERQKEILSFSFIQNMKDKEIAKKLKVSQQSVSKTKKAALNKLRREINIV